MNTTYNFLKSRTFWTILVTIAIGGVNAAMPFMTDSAQTFVQALLGILAIYFHTSTAVKAGATN